MGHPKHPDHIQPLTKVVLLPPKPQEILTGSPGSPRGPTSPSSPCSAAKAQREAAKETEQSSYISVTSQVFHSC